MEVKKITAEIIKDFAEYLQSDEKSKNTLEKYLRDVRTFAEFAEKGKISKETVIAFKQKLVDEKYAARSINSMLASINSLLVFLGWQNFKVKSLKIQREVFCSEDKELTREEYERLCRAAEEAGKPWLSLLIQTLCGMGIRVGETENVTVEAVEKGEAVVKSKGKTRTVFIVKALRKKLLRYIKKHNIKSGAVFITKNGKPIDRTTIWREMKALCEAANVDPQKVFPHNLRHLFARIFHAIEKDIAKLADILGHSSIDTTRIYIISTGAEHRRKMEMMHLIL